MYIRGYSADIHTCFHMCITISIYTETKKFINTFQILVFITEIHVEINTEFLPVNAITISFNTKYFMHLCKISFVWNAVPVIKCFQKDKMSIF